jgi:DNA-directed RNA polymerase III subunit RPC1
VNGISTHPGAWFVLFPNGGKWFLKYGDRKRIAAELKVRLDLDMWSH